MTKEARVFHKKLGWGTVMRVVERLAKKGYWVDFGYFKEFINQEDLEFTEQTTESPPMMEPTGIEPVNGTVPSTPEAVEVAADSRRGMLALRLGQILEADIRRLSVGTGELEEALAAALDRARKGLASFLIVEGAWGGGKTHALTLLQAMARRDRFATSSVVMDGDAVSLADPMQLMEGILGSFCFPAQGNADQLMDVVRGAVRQERLPEIRQKGATKIAGALTGIPREAFLDTEALGLLQDYFSLGLSTSQARTKMKLLGYRVNLPILRANRVDQRVEAFRALLANWAFFSSAMGARGLLVLVDELDVEYAATAYGDKASMGKRQKRNALLHGLEKLCGQNVPVVVAFASAPAGPDLEPHNDAVEDLKQIFGPGILHLHVPPPSEASLAEMLLRLSAFYVEAYPDARDRIDDKVVQMLLEGLLQRHRRSSSPVPRQFVRTVLETLDLITVGGIPCEEVLRMLRGSR